MDKNYKHRKNILLKYAKDNFTKRHINIAYKDIIRFHKTGKYYKSKALNSYLVLNFISHKVVTFRDCLHSILNEYYDIFFRNEHFRVIKPIMKKNAVVVDLGASHGFFTIKTKLLNINSKIYSVEPNPKAFDLLSKNIDINNLKEVELIDKAITTKNSDVSFQVVDEVLKIASTKINTKSFKWLDKDRIKQIVVDSSDLDTFFCDYGINKCDFLKIDIEGSEFTILKKSSLLSNIDTISVECHSLKIYKKIYSLLVTQNYKLLYKEEVNNGFIEAYFKNHLFE